jgi:hypothetical protein
MKTEITPNKPFILTQDNMGKIGITPEDTSIIIPETFYSRVAGVTCRVTGIADKAFFNCPDIKSVNIPGSVTEIGNEAFCHCEKLERVSGMEGVTSIGDGAFLGCYSLKEITIPDCVTDLGAGAFEDCTKCETLTVPKALTELKEWTFSNSGIKSAAVPDGIPVAENAFAGCRNLEEPEEDEGIER